MLVWLDLCLDLVEHSHVVDYEIRAALREEIDLRLCISLPIYMSDFLEPCGIVAEWSKAADLSSAEGFLAWVRTPSISLLLYCIMLAIAMTSAAFFPPSRASRLLISARSSLDYTTVISICSFVKNMVNTSRFRKNDQ